jgi:DNA-binding MarR family transcriptional regulator
MVERSALTRLVLAIFRAHQALVNAGDRRVAELGRNSARWKVLGAIELAEGSLTAAAIGREMGLSRQAAQKQLDALLAEGLVDRRDNPAHQRAPLFVLTARGRKTFTRADAIWSEWARVLGRGIAKERWHEAAELLRTLTQRVEEEA